MNEVNYFEARKNFLKAKKFSPSKTALQLGYGIFAGFLKKKKNKSYRTNSYTPF